MDFSYSPDDERFRTALRAWLAANRPARPERIPHDDASLAAEFAFLRDWQRRLSSAGYVGLLWPSDYGGRGARPTEQAILNQELARARAPQLLNRVGVNNTGPTLIAHGTEAQKRRFLPPILSADEIWCQLFSEPGAGSDLAALRTRAEPDGDGFMEQAVDDTIGLMLIMTEVEWLRKHPAGFSPDNNGFPIGFPEHRLIVQCNAEGIEPYMRCIAYPCKAPVAELIYIIARHHKEIVMLASAYCI